jgi:hypothetical protein
MSGYLQRLASSVLHPASAVHPLLTPLWVAPRKMETPETTLIEDETSRAAVQPNSFAETRQTVRDQTTPASTDRFTDVTARPEVARTVSEPTTNPAASDPYRPLVAAKQHGTIIRPASQLASVKNEPIDAKEPNEADGVQQSEATKQAVHAQFKPLVDPVILPPQATSQIRAALPAQNADHRTHARPQSMAQSAREPDEIQIHIGRIEVTAALPQPPARPQVKPVRKSLDLGEYLKRDRRAR